MTYNGWTNYETWAVGMYLDGNYTGEHTYREVLDLVATLVQEGEPWLNADTTLYAVEGALKNWAREMIEDDIEGIASDLLGSALDEVNWLALAEHKLAEVKES